MLTLLITNSINAWNILNGSLAGDDILLSQVHSDLGYHILTKGLGKEAVVTAVSDKYI